MSCTDLSLQKKLFCGLCSTDSAPLFAQFSQLLTHLDECHQPLRIYACHYCSRGFASKGRLFNHDCQSFQKTFESKRMGMYEDHNFGYQFRLLICCKCGLQMFINNNVDSDERSRSISQLQRCFELHEHESLVYCIVCMLDTTTFEVVKLTFLTNDKTLQDSSREAFLPVYIAEATQLKDFAKNNANRSKIRDSFYGDEDLPRMKKGLTHSTFFNKFELENNNEEYECKICKSRTTPNPKPHVLVQHIRDNHHSKYNAIDGNQPRSTFNAQIQFTRIDLGDGQCQYACKICGHLTKNNVKANALSQHFNDRHPEKRLLASETLVDRYLKRYGHLIMDGNSKENESALVVIDKSAAELNDFVKNFLVCETSVRIYFSPFETLHSEISKGLELLDYSVFACELCDTLCAGELSATSHFDHVHRAHPKSSVEDKNQMTPLMTVHKSRPALRCLFCESLHCSIMGLKLHLFRAHQAIFAVAPKEVGEKIYAYQLSSRSPSVADAISSRSLFSLPDVKMEVVTDECAACEDDLISNSSVGFKSKLEQILQNVNTEIEKSEATEAASSNGANLEFDFGTSSANYDGEEMNFTSRQYNNRRNATFATHNGNDLKDGNIHRESTSGDPQEENGYRLIDEDDWTESCSEQSTSNTLSLQKEMGGNTAARSLKLRAKKYKIRRFNAQEQFVMVDSPEGPRYKCKICNHVTKPSVSANTLSQHFSYRHPEMRANASGQIAPYGRRRKVKSPPPSFQKPQIPTPPSSTSSTELAMVIASKSNNFSTELSTSLSQQKRRFSNAGYNGRRTSNRLSLGGRLAATNSPPHSPNNALSSVDDIVFGKFIQTKSLEEFDRLERSQSTVFPYFEIAIKTNVKISCQLAGALSILYAENLNSSDKCTKVVNFFGEILRRSRANNDDLLQNMDRNLSVDELNFSGILKILDDLLKRNGF